MKYSITIFLFTLCILFTGCEPSGYQNDDLAAFTLIQYECPYESSYFSYSEIVEQDDYGRTLFKFWGGSDLAYESDTGFLYIYAIIQKDTDEWVWFYDTDCYMMQPSWEDFTESRLIELKNRNHWNTEINIAQADRVKRVPKNQQHISVSYSIRDIENVVSSIRTSDEYYDYIPISNDQNGQTLFFFRTYTRDEQGATGNYSAYAIIMQADGSYSENSIVKFDDFYNHTEQLKELKANNRWEISQSDE